MRTQPPVSMSAASDCAHHRRRTTAWTRTRSGCRPACSACTHRARTPWPLRRRRARAPTLTVTPNPKPNPSPNTNPKPNTNQASPSSLGRRGACMWLPRPMPMAMRPNRLPLIETVRSVCATSWFSRRFCLKKKMAFLRGPPAPHPGFLITLVFTIHHIFVAPFQIWSPRRRGARPRPRENREPARGPRSVDCARCAPARFLIISGLFTIINYII